MKGILVTGACAAAIALAPIGAWADSATNEDAQSQDGVQHLVQQIESLTEIGELAVVHLRRAAAEEEAAADDPGQMSQDDLLMGGFGERQMLTAEDEDDPFEADRADQAPTHGPEAQADATEATRENGPLQEAIEGNAALSQALGDRGINVAHVVSVEVRGGTSVIVYVDETRS